MQKPGCWFFTSKMYEKQLCITDILGKDAGRQYPQEEHWEVIG